MDSKQDQKSALVPKTILGLDSGEKNNHPLIGKKIDKVNIYCMGEKLTFFWSAAADVLRRIGYIELHVINGINDIQFLEITKTEFQMFFGLLLKNKYFSKMDIGMKENIFANITFSDFLEKYNIDTDIINNVKKIPKSDIINLVDKTCIWILEQIKQQVEAKDYNHKKHGINTSGDFTLINEKYNIIPNINLHIYDDAFADLRGEIIYNYVSDINKYFIKNSNNILTCRYDGGKTINIEFDTYVRYKESLGNMEIIDAVNACFKFFSSK
jgi:hypothetical protein